MGLVNLDIFPRQTKGKNANRKTRAAGKIPAVLYGTGREQTESVEVDAVQFGKILTRLAGKSVIFSLKLEAADDEPIALLRDVQRNPVTDEILHVDLYEIPRGKTIEVPVQIEVVGESTAVKRGDANVSLVMYMVELSCLPREMPEVITIDITEMGLNDKIHVKDLKTEVGEFVSDPEALVLMLKAPTIYVAEEAVAAEGEEDEAGEGEAGESEGESKDGADAAKGKSDKD
ncbi:MAG: 50S ribosomal protein L25 [bacterium]